MIKHRLIFIALLTFLVSPVVSSRTFRLSDSDCVRIAMIASDAPRLSWAGNRWAERYGTGGLTFTNNATRRSAFLIVFPLERIPEGMQVTKAILNISCHTNTHGVPRLQIRRIIGDWGDGVCHLYRRTLPEKVPWTRPGAAAIGADRARRATAVVKLISIGEFTANVTEDVELWYSQTIPNNGWILSLETGDGINFPSPTAHPGSWTLDVSYERRRDRPDTRGTAEPK